MIFHWYKSSSNSRSVCSEIDSVDLSFPGWIVYIKFIQVHLLSGILKFVSLILFELR